MHLILFATVSILLVAVLFVRALDKRILQVIESQKYQEHVG
jgi:hypothetical protein